MKAYLERLDSSLLVEAILDFERLVAGLDQSKSFFVQRNHVVFPQAGMLFLSAIWNQAINIKPQTQNPEQIWILLSASLSDDSMKYSIVTVWWFLSLTMAPWTGPTSGTSSSQYFVSPSFPLAMNGAWKPSSLRWPPVICFCRNFRAEWSAAMKKAPINDMKSNPTLRIKVLNIYVIDHLQVTGALDTRIWQTVSLRTLVCSSVRKAKNTWRHLQLPKSNNLGHYMISIRYLFQP